jgi:hypothetical protein
MSDNPESAANGEQPSPPSDDVSQDAGQQTFGGQDVGALVDAILEHDRFKKATQSVKDKRIAQIQTNLEEQGSDIARLAEALGHTPEEVRKAQNQLVMEDMVKAYQSGNLEFPPSPVSDQKSQGSDLDLSNAAMSILEKHGLKSAPAGFDDYLASLDWNDPIQAALSASDWVQEAQANKPSNADIAPPTGSSPAGDDSDKTDEELSAELRELQRNPRQTAARRKEINAILRKRREKNK